MNNTDAPRIIKTLTAQEAVIRLRSHGIKIGEATLRKGLEQRRYPFGECILTDGGTRTFIYLRLLEDWIAERVMPAK